MISLVGPARQAVALDHSSWDDLQAERTGTSPPAAKVTEIKTVVAGAGEPGAADGCHPHCEVRVDGEQIAAAPIVADRGALRG